MIAGVKVTDNRYLDGPVFHLIGEIPCQEAVDFRVTGTRAFGFAADYGKNEEYRKGTAYDFLHDFFSFP
jgi:hypothetical protein